MRKLTIEHAASSAVFHSTSRLAKTSATGLEDDNKAAAVLVAGALEA